MQFYGWSVEYVRKGITGAQGWAYYSWAMANEPARWMQSPLEPTKSPVWQEIERLKHERGT